MCVESRSRPHGGTRLPPSAHRVPRPNTQAPSFWVPIYACFWAYHPPHICTSPSNRRAMFWTTAWVFIFPRSLRFSSILLSLLHPIPGVLGRRKPAGCTRPPTSTSTSSTSIRMARRLAEKGFDSFWFDFDSVWLKNPWPVLQQALATWLRREGPMRWPSKP